ncbi:conserved Plasmodium protein, unknown function [Plasmodium chabaudi chabaudi]|uniref:Uncharacterized protein n=1 Tax=Plasmodium chabaudi chabaudi TaxID=31271 RepID=A0A077TJS6_PLACU|nr:conserved protein, unknown function [Plasmodium chabaudi chabaudi]SCN58605.1 conserved Plasmodium protein, unknown function [Plasmodium chabaudi chabaudi]VTZ66219.1 conserved protein, unknown function [Plasmodium chabaudi chabaudi]|eukprot:XP_016652976.1 conserved Plasmodium protein, unknown function [Plasmodium chabaudi chabaudi]
MNILSLYISFFMFILLSNNYGVFSSSTSVDKNGNILLLKDMKPGNSKETLKNELINKIKKKANHIRMLYNVLNEKNINKPIYIFITDQNEKKKQFLKDLYLLGKLDSLQGFNTPISKYYISLKNKTISYSMLLGDKINNERKYINGLSVEDKETYVKDKIDEYENLRVSVNQMSSNIDKKFKSIEELMAFLKN